mmetsp:Transcript_6798/g.12616  ORF Transcript_6798/g.12616 Transcript_6798/m.12616 type:complete len:206 (+) Transcript_6798:84-701(+)
MTLFYVAVLTCFVFRSCVCPYFLGLCSHSGALAFGPLLSRFDVTVTLSRLGSRLGLVSSILQTLGDGCFPFIFPAFFGPVIFLLWISNSWSLLHMVCCCYGRIRNFELQPRGKHLGIPGSNNPNQFILGLCRSNIDESPTKTLSVKLQCGLERFFVDNINESNSCEITRVFFIAETYAMCLGYLYPVFLKMCRYFGFGNIKWKLR